MLAVCGCSHHGYLHRVFVSRATTKHRVTISFYARCGAVRTFSVTIVKRTFIDFSISRKHIRPHGLLKYTRNRWKRVNFKFHGVREIACISDRTFAGAFFKTGHRHFFFENKRGEAVTVNPERYSQTLHHFFFFIFSSHNLFNMEWLDIFNKMELRVEQLEWARIFRKICFWTVQILKTGLFLGVFLIFSEVLDRPIRRSVIFSPQSYIERIPYKVYRTTSRTIDDPEQGTRLKVVQISRVLFLNVVVRLWWTSWRSLVPKCTPSREHRAQQLKTTLRKRFFFLYIYILQDGKDEYMS
jgi:hypothetical protein